MPVQSVERNMTILELHPLSIDPNGSSIPRSIFAWIFIVVNSINFEWFQFNFKFQVPLEKENLLYLKHHWALEQGK